MDGADGDAVPFEAYYDLTTVGEPAVSPDGERVAFTTTEYDADEDERRGGVFVAPADGSREPHRLTRASDASSPAWSPDGSKLGVVATRETDAEIAVEGGADEEDAEEEDGDDDENDGNGNGDSEEPESQVWYWDLDRGGDACQVTDHEEGVQGFDWGPDGERVVVSARDPTDEQREALDEREDGGPIEIERLQHKFDGAGYLDDVQSYLFVVDVESREERRLDDAHGGGVFPDVRGLRPRWSPDGDRIAFVANHGEDPDDTYGTGLFTIAPDGSDRRTLVDAETTTSFPRWSPDGERVAFGRGDPENWYRPTEVCVVPRGGGEVRSLTADLDRTVGYGGAPRWLDDATLLAGIADGGRTRLTRLHADAAPDGDDDSDGNEGGASAVRLPATDSETVVGMDADGGTVALTVSAPDERDLHTVSVDELDALPGDRHPPVAGGRPAGSEGAEPGENGSADEGDPRTRLTRANDGVFDYEGPAFERAVVAEREEGPVEAMVYRPPGADGEDDPRPLVLAIHGGPMAYDAPAFSFDTHAWTSRGYAVLRVNYRGSTSYGREFCETLKGRWGSIEVDDLRAGVDWAVEAGLADPDRLFCTGFSQGGVNTAYVVTETDRFAAAAAEHGVYDLRSSFGTDDSQNWLEADFGLPWEEPEAYDRSSSITDVGAIDTPLLVTAGENDWRCPPSQGEQLYVSVRKRGVDAKFVLYQGEHHAIGAPDRAIHRIETLTDWFEDHDPAVD